MTMAELRDYLPIDQYKPLPPGIIEEKDLELRRSVRRLPTWKLKRLYEGIKDGTIDIDAQLRAVLFPYIKEAMWERGKLPTEEG